MTRRAENQLRQDLKGQRSTLSRESGAHENPWGRGGGVTTYLELLVCGCLLSSHSLPYSVLTCPRYLVSLAYMSNPGGRGYGVALLVGLKAHTNMWVKEIWAYQKNMGRALKTTHAPFLVQSYPDPVLPCPLLSYPNPVLSYTTLPRT